MAKAGRKTSLNRGLSNENIRLVAQDTLPAAEQAAIDSAWDDLIALLLKMRERDAAARNYN